MDPSQALCPACGTEQLKPVRELLALAATCDVCGASLDQTGREMQAMLDEWHLFCYRGFLAQALEKRLGITVSDGDMARMSTGEDVVTFTARKSADAASVAASALRELEVELPTDWRGARLDDLLLSVQ